MKIIKQDANVKCDIGNCKNKADYSIVAEGVGTRQYLNICKECMESLNAEFGKMLAPRAIVNIMARGENLAVQTIGENFALRNEKEECNSNIVKDIINGKINKDECCGNIVKDAINCKGKSEESNSNIVRDAINFKSKNVEGSRNIAKDAIKSKIKKEENSKNVKSNELKRKSKKELIAIMSKLNNKKSLKK